MQSNCTSDVCEGPQCAWNVPPPQDHHGNQGSEMQKSPGSCRSTHHVTGEGRIRRVTPLQAQGSLGLGSVMDEGGHRGTQALR